MHARRIILAVLVTSSLLTTACFREVAKSLTEVRKVYEALDKEFGEPVFVNVNEGSNHLALNVSFINSALNSRSRDERAARAQRAAEIVKQTYTRINNLDAIWVGFIRQETHYVIFHRSDMIDYFSFYKDGRRIMSRAERSGVTGSGVQLEVTATYSSTSDVSDVSASGIQLEGQPGGLGVTVLPHFTVPGDVRTEKIPPPKTVTFDFASYAEKPRFRQTEPITLLADEEPVLQLGGQFNGKGAQFCLLPVPYAAFRKMIAAHELTIKVGGKDEPLKPSEFAMIQRMGEYVQ